eukprot:9472672-Pyramimonas_sp.AAC.1
MARSARKMGSKADGGDPRRPPKVYDDGVRPGPPWPGSNAGTFWHSRLARSIARHYDAGRPGASNPSPALQGRQGTSASAAA